MATRTIAPRRLVKKPEERPRVRIGEAISEVFDTGYWRELAESIKGMTTMVWGSGRCPECGSTRKVQVEIPDIKGQLAAAGELIEQAYGRPGTDSAEQQGTTIVVRRPAR